MSPAQLKQLLMIQPIKDSVLHSNRTNNLSSKNRLPIFKINYFGDLSYVRPGKNCGGGIFSNVSIYVMSHQLIPSRGCSTNYSFSVQQTKHFQNNCFNRSNVRHSKWNGMFKMVIQLDYYISHYKSDKQFCFFFFLFTLHTGFHSLDVVVVNIRLGKKPWIREWQT